MTCDSGSRPTGRDVKQARGEARQSGAESASPMTKAMTDAKVELVADARGNNPWPENSDYGKFWRRGYDSGRSDAVKELMPRLLAALEHSDAVMGEDIAKSVIAEANNSLFGSQSYFVTTAEGRVAGSVGVSEPPDKYHLARPIEALKSDSRAAWRALRQLEEELPNAALGTLRAALKRSTPTAPVQDDRE